MIDTLLQTGSLVLYKTRPALVRQIGKKLTIELETGETLSVRPKDVELLHPGPLDRLASLRPRAGEIKAAWELLAGSSASLEEFAELAFGDFTPATAWAAWQAVADGLYFQGQPREITARPAEDVAREQATRQAKAAQEAAWAAFLSRIRQNRFKPEDAIFLRDVENLAYGRQEKSRILRELGLSQTPENAHTLLLKLGYWGESVNPYPQRLGVITASAEAPLADLPDEERLDLTHLPAFAIDDEGNQDPDDAISLDQAGRLWVHVADAAALALPDSPADLEARARGANLYLPEGIVHMLPAAATRQLGLGLADLSPALSFGLDVNDAGEISGIDVTPSWVRVTRLTYEEAEARLDEEPLAALDALLRRRQAYRRRNGAVFIDLPEAKIRVVDGRVDIRPLALLRSRDLVAEAMMAAGEAAARFALNRQIPLPFTVQEATNSSDELLPDGLAGMFARRRTLQASQQSGTPGPHSGLGLALYARATSPLRRYLDLVVHQQLRAHLRSQTLLDAQAVLERVGAAEAVSGSLRQAERLSNQHWTLVYLEQNPDWQGAGILVDLYGLRGTVLIPALAWETRLNLRDPLPLNSKLLLAVDGINLPQLEAYFQIIESR